MCAGLPVFEILKNDNWNNFLGRNVVPIPKDWFYKEYIEASFFADLGLEKIVFFFKTKIHTTASHIVNVT